MTQEDSAVVLREQDQEECRLGGLEPSVALDLSIRHSTHAFAVKVQGEVIAYWGFRSTMLAGHANVWMLSTPAIERHRTFAARKSLEFMNHLLTAHYRLDCIVSDDYSTAVRWLRWLGFTRRGTFGPYTVMSIERGGAA